MIRIQNASSWLPYPVLLLALLFPDPARGGPSFRYDFEGPDVIGGRPGEIASADFFCRVHTTGLAAGEEGIKGWAISVSTTDACRITAASSDETAGAPEAQGGLRRDGFESIEFTADGRGVVAGFVLSFSENIFLDPGTSPHRTLKLTVEARVPAQGGCISSALVYQDGLVGQGEPIDNHVTYQRQSLFPALERKSFQICPVPCFPSVLTPGWIPFDVGRVLAGASRPVAGARDAYELCSLSAGYGSTSDSFRFLFRMLRASWVLSARLESLEGGGCAGLDARAHRGSSELHNHPYVAVFVEQDAAGGLVLRSRYRTEVGGRASEEGSDPIPVRLPVHIRIARTGREIATFFSDDGVNYRPHLVVETSESGLDIPLFRAGMKQASGSLRGSSAVFSQASTEVREDIRPPLLTRVEPNVATIDGNTRLKIIGERLEGASRVTIGGLEAQILSREDDAIEVLSPASREALSGDVVVETRTGAQILTNGVTLIGGGFIRSDCNGDGITDISDAVAKLNFLFTGGPPCQCFEASDSNSDQRCDLSDAVFTLGYLFLGKEPPSAPFPDPGVPDGPHVPCRLPALPDVQGISLPPGQNALKEGDVFTLTGSGFPDDPSSLMVFLGNTPAEVIDVSPRGVTARAGRIAEDIRQASVGIFLDLDIAFPLFACKPSKCSPFVIAVGDLVAEVRVDLTGSGGIVPIGTSMQDRGTAVIPFDTANLDPQSAIGVMGRIIVPPVAGDAGLSRGSRVISFEMRGGSARKSPEALGADLADLLQEQVNGGGDTREFEVFFDAERRAIMIQTDRALTDFVARQDLPLDFDISIYGFGRPPPCTCEADLDLDGTEESYTPLVDDRGYAWCRLYHLWKSCNGLPAWEYLIPRNCVYIESGTTCESDGTSSYPIFPLPHPHTINPGVKSAMFNRSAYCHIRKHSLWNLCKLRDLELLGDTQVPHFPRDAVVVKTEWRTSVSGSTGLYYHYDFDNGVSEQRQYLVAWHFTDKCIDNWTWCDLYIDATDGGAGGCGGTNSDLPPALVGTGLDNYYMCVNVRITDSDTSCGNTFFPECNVSNCMACHHPDGAGGFSGADNAWSNPIGGGALGSDFLYSLTSGPAIPTGGLSDGDHPSCTD